MSFLRRHALFGGTTPLVAAWLVSSTGNLMMPAYYLMGASVIGIVSVLALHGDLDQSLRTKTLDAFRANELKLLVASDVAARGLDIPAVSHIFNFDVPFHADDYVHRIGRTGRAGRSGVALMLATERESKYVEAIEKLTGGPIAKRRMEGIEVREDRGPRRDETVELTQ